MSTQGEIPTIGDLIDIIEDGVVRAYTVLKNKGVQPDTEKPETAANLADTIDIIKTADVDFDPITGILAITTVKR